MKKRRAHIGFAVVTASFLFLVFGFVAARAAGDIVITEIAASPGNKHEWVEVYNRGAASIDVAGWKFWEDGTNHALTFTGDASTLQPGGFAVIAQDAATFAADYPAFSGLLIDSSWSSLKETGEEIGLKDSSGALVEVFAYVPAPDQFLNRKIAGLDEYGESNWVEGATTVGALWQQSDVATEEPVQDVQVIPSGGHEEEMNYNQSPFHYAWENVWINEMVSDPASGENEWIELKSNHVNNIDLKDWILKDGNDHVTELSDVLPAFGYIVIEKPKGSLNNAGDRVALVDHEDNTIDELFYGTWENPALAKNPLAPGRGQALARTPGILSAGKNNIDFVLTSTPTKNQENSITPIALQGNNTVSVQESEHIAVTSSTVIASSTLPVINKPFAAEEFLLGGKRAVLTVYDVAASSTPLHTLVERLCVPQVIMATAQQITSTAYAVATLQGQGAFSLYEATQTSAGVKVIAQGVVTVLPGVLGLQYFYIQDADAGIQVYQNKKLFPRLAVGDTVKVSGELSRVNGQARLKVKTQDDIVVVNHAGAPQSLRVGLDDMSDEYVGRLITTQGTITDKRSGYWFIDNGINEVRVAIRTGSGIENGLYKEGTVVAVTGIVMKTTSGMQLVPRSVNDFVVIETPWVEVEQGIASSTTTSTPVIGKTSDQSKNSSSKETWSIIRVLMVMGFVSGSVALLAKYKASGIME